RVVAATNHDLEAAVREGAFREDLLYRLNVVEIAVPALRERPEDILPMARRFLAQFAKGTRKAVPELSPAAEKALLGYGWPGNVRELRNAIERAIILWPAQVIERRPSRGASPPPDQWRPTWAATSRLRRWSASTSCACSRAPSAWTTPRTSWGST